MNRTLQRAKFSAVSVISGSSQIKSYPQNRQKEIQQSRLHAVGFQYARFVLKSSEQAAAMELN